MRFNFRKIASVIASAVMLGSTAGMAAAANYPAPYVQGGIADVAIVVGANAAASDSVAASDISSDLADVYSSQTATGGEVTTSGGDSVKIEKSSNKLNINEPLTDVRSTKITDNDMPNFLADGTYRSDDNVDYDYEQSLSLTYSPSLKVTHFSDNDYKDKEPSLGIHLAKSTIIMNYTLDFKTNVKSDVDTTGSYNALEDMEDTEITMMGVKYTLLNAYNRTSGDKKFVLMGGAVKDNINLNEQKVYTVGGKTYTVTLTYVDSDELKFEVNGETTPKLKKGDTYKLADGTQLGVTEVLYQALSGGVMRGEFTLGANKLEITGSSDGDGVPVKIKLNDDDVDDVWGYITTASVSDDKQVIDKIDLVWKVKDEQFITPEQSLTMPGFETVTLSMGDMTFPAEEKVKVYNSGQTVYLKTTIKDGEIDLPILYGNKTTFTNISEDENDNFLVTDGNTSHIRINANDRSIIFNDSAGDLYFVVSWNDTTSAESYLLTVDSITQDSNNENKTTIKNVVTGDKYSDYKRGETITIGNVEILIDEVYYDDDSVILNLTGCAGCTFNRLYTAEGLEILLPWVNDSCSDAVHGCIALTDTAANHPQTWPLYMIEEDKDGDLGEGEEIQVNLSWSDNEPEVSEVAVTYFARDDAANGDSSGGMKEIGNTDKYEGYLNSSLATKFLFYKPSSGQNELEIIYHGDEVYANVFVTAPGVTVGSTGTGKTLGSITVKDSEVNSVSDKNLIVVGGSCINKAAAKILGSDVPLCEADFTAKTGVGADQFLIKVVKSPYNSAKIAMLVAGYEAADTTSAAKYVTTEKPSTDTGTILKKVTTTYTDVA